MNMMRDAVKELAADMLLGEQKAGQLCPSCRGGLTGERSFSIERAAGRANYCCHRSSCGWSGSVNMSALVDRPENKKPRQIVQEPKTGSIPKEVADYIKEKYFLTDEDITMARMKWSEDKRLVIPIIDRFGNSIGNTYRSLDGAKPKSKIILKQATTPCMGWYPKRGGFRQMYSLTEPVLLVEDQLSAIRASKYVIAVALLGTHISDAKLSEIGRTGTQDVILALDEDATDKSAGYMIKLSGIFDRVRMRYLKKDLKNSTDEEIEEILELKGT